MPTQTNGDLILYDGQGWGKINGGQRYGILADDMAALLSLADFTKAEARLMDEIRQRSWGESARRKRPGHPWPDAKPARINFAELSRQLDPDPTRAESWRCMLMRAKRALIRDRFIVEADGGFLINKDADEWGRLTPADRAYAATKRTYRAGPTGHGGRDQPVPPGVTNQSRGVVLVGHTERDQPVTPPLIGTRASEIPEDSGRHLTVCETAGAHTESDLSPEEEAEAEREAVAFREYLESESEGRDGNAGA